MEGSCQHAEKNSPGHPTRVVVQTEGKADGLQPFVYKNTSVLQNVTHGVGLGRILWNDLIKDG